MIFGATIENGHITFPLDGISSWGLVWGFGEPSTLEIEGVAFADFDGTLIKEFTKYRESVSHECPACGRPDGS